MSTEPQLWFPGTDVEPFDGAAAIVRAAVEAFESVIDCDPETTKKAYKSAWRNYERWAAQACRPGAPFFGRQPVPVTPDMLVAHLQWLTSACKRKPNGVRQAMSAIASLDRAARATPTDPDPVSVTKSVIVQRWYKKWSRSNPRAATRQAAHIERREMLRILEVLGDSKSSAPLQRLPLALRDQAMALVGTKGALRVSELVALEVPHDIVETHRGLDIHVRRGKVDQQGRGKTKGILHDSERALCAVEAWRRWMRVRGNAPGPAFVAVNRRGELASRALTTRAVQRIISNAAKRAEAIDRAAGLFDVDGVTPYQLVSSHSMRATFVTLASRKHPLEVVSKHVGHESLQTTLDYQREDHWANNPTGDLFTEG